MENSSHVPTNELLILLPLMMGRLEKPGCQTKFAICMKFLILCTVAVRSLYTGHECHGNIQLFFFWGRNII